MSAPEIHISKDLESLSRGAAEEFVSLAALARPRGAPFTAALSGGSTPKRFCELLATPEFSSRVRWADVQLFQVDERCVPPADDRSNYKMIREALLDRVSGIHFSRMEAEQPDREAASRKYADQLRAVLRADAEGWPRFDVIYLGMGDDGHTASLFPGSAALAEQERAVVPNYVAKFGMYRLTLTMPVINAAARAVFLVAGRGKAERIKEVLGAPAGSAPQFPAQWVNPSQGSVAWRLDEEAASFLQRV